MQSTEASPPANDLREALARVIYEHESRQPADYMAQDWESRGSSDVRRLLYLYQADAILSRFEVRLRGTVADA